MLRIRRVLCSLLFLPALAAHAAAPHVAFLVGEDEYKTWETLPAFAKEHLEPLGVKCTFVMADPKNLNHFPDIAKIDDADVLFVSVRRRPMPEAELKHVRDFMKAGKPLVGIRTASHAFAAQGPKAAGRNC